MKRDILKSILLFLVPAFVVSTVRIAADPMPVRSFTKLQDGILVHLMPGFLRLTVWDSDVIRVRFSMHETLADRQASGLAGRARKARWTVREDQNAVYLSTDRLTARVNKRTGAISFLDIARHAILRELPTGGRTVTPALLNGRKGFEIVQVFTSPPGEKLFVVREVRGRGVAKALATKRTMLKSSSGACFVLSSQGYGILWYNSSLTYFDPAEPHSSGETRAEPYARKTFRSATGNDINYFFCFGPDLCRVIDEYKGIVHRL